MAAHKVFRTCARCGEEFWARGRKFCSRACYIESKRAGEERECPVCGSPFYSPRWEDRRTCSRECALKWRSIALRGPGSCHWKGGPPVKRCAGCGKRFRVLDYDRAQKYCSKRCYGAHQSRVAREAWPSARCANCGNGFRYSPQKSSGVLCSNRCRVTWQRGPNAPGYIHGRSHRRWGGDWARQRRRAVERDGHACAACGASGVRLEVHHRVPRALFGRPENANRLSNLVTLCVPCHREAERESRMLYRTGQMFLIA